VRIVIALRGETEIVFDVAIFCRRGEKEACTLGDTEIYRPVRVLNVDRGEGKGGGRGDGAVAVCDRDAALYAVERDVLVVGFEDDRSKKFVGIKAIAAHAEVSVNACSFEVCAAGFEENKTVDVFEVGGAEEVAAEVDRTGDLGEIGIPVVALDSEVAGNAVGIEAGIVVVDVDADIAVDRIEVNIAVVGGESDRGVDFADVDVTVVGLYRNGGVVRNLDDQVALSAVDGGNGHDEILSFCRKAGTEALSFILRVLIFPGVGLGVDVDVNLSVRAGAGDGDITVGIANDETGGGIYGGGEGVIAIVAVTEDVVEVVKVLTEIQVGPGDAAEDHVREKASDGEQDEKEDNAAAKNTNRAVNALVLAALVDTPLGEQNEAGTDEDGRPPAAVPLQRLGPWKLSSFGEEKDDANGKDNQRAEDGTAAGGTHLETDLSALHAGLIFEKTALGAHGLTVVRIEWRWRRRRGRISGHPSSRPLSCRSPSTLHDWEPLAERARQGERQRYMRWEADCRLTADCRRPDDRLCAREAELHRGR
jgi:hypothetical protein